MINFVQIRVPLTTVASVDDSLFPKGRTEKWVKECQQQRKASIAAGFPVSGRVYVAKNIARRMLGVAEADAIDDVSAPFLQNSGGKTGETLTFYVDTDLTDDTVRLE